MRKCHIFFTAHESGIKYQCGTRFVGIIVSAVNCVGTAGSVASGTPHTAEIWNNNPVLGGKYWVAFFHTHTPLTYCQSGARSPTCPSPTDYSYATSNNVPCILYDYVSVNNIDPITGETTYGIVAGHPIDAAHTYWTFGPIRRVAY